MDRHELAWAAGFFDGEGWADLEVQEGRRTGQPMARVNQADPDGVPEVLIRFQKALGGLGTIGGPDRKEGRIDLYRWQVSSRGNVELAHHFLMPWLGQVKLLAFATALERTGARSRNVTPGDDWRAWAAGLYDGEGSTYLTDHRTHQGYRNAEARITQSGLGHAPEVLARFTAIVGVGQIYGPYVQRGAVQDVYRWNASARADIERAIAVIWPWLGTVKRTQAASVLDVVRSQPALPRGRVEWGSHKTHCIHGHEYATSRMRPYVARSEAGSPPRDSEQCLVCAREQARRRRGQKRRSAAHPDRRSISESPMRYLLK